MAQRGQGWVKARRARDCLRVSRGAARRGAGWWDDRRAETATLGPLWGPHGSRSHRRRVSVFQIVLHAKTEGLRRCADTLKN